MEPNVFIYLTREDGSIDTHEYNNSDPHHLKELLFALHSIVNNTCDYRQVTITTIKR